jgi:hypothetical protein
MPTWYSPLVVIVLVLLACGLASCAFGSRRTLLAWYFLAYFTVYLLWPFDVGPRFMLPVAPLAFILIWRGVRVFVHLLHTRPGATLGTIAALGACLTVVTGTADRLPGLQAQASMLFWPFVAIGSGFFWVLARRSRAAQARAALDSLVAFLCSCRAQYGIVCGVVVLVGIGVYQQAAHARTNLAPDASSFRFRASADFSYWLRGSAQDGVVMAQHYTIVHRLSGRRVVGFPITSDPKIILKVVASENVRYLVVNDPVKYEYYFPTEEERWRRIDLAAPSMFHLVHRGPGYRVFERSGQ